MLRDARPVRNMDQCSMYQLQNCIRSVRLRASSFDPLFHSGPITRRKIRLGKALPDRKKFRRSPDTEPIGKRKRRAKQLERRYLLHPIALHSRLKQMNPWSG